MALQDTLEELNAASTDTTERIARFKAVMKIADDPPTKALISR